MGLQFEFRTCGCFDTNQEQALRREKWYRDSIIYYINKSVFYQCKSVAKALTLIQR